MGKGQEAQPAGDKLPADETKGGLVDCWDMQVVGFAKMSGGESIHEVSKGEWKWGGSGRCAMAVR